MYLKNIHITNFRCFQDYRIDFAPKVTILYGKNGSGKTTLIHALHKVLSFMMYSENIYETVLVKGKKRKKIIDVHTITNNNPYLHPKGYAKDDFNNQESKFINIKAEADLDDDLDRYKAIEWKISALANKCKLRPAEFIDAFHVFQDWHNETNILPLLAYFSDSFPHKEDNKKPKVVSKIRNLRNFGYFDWDEEEGCINEWIDRLEDNLKTQVLILSKSMLDPIDGVLNIDDGDKQLLSSLRNEHNAITDRFVIFTNDSIFHDDNGIQVKSLSLGKNRENIGKLCVISTSGDEYPFRKLPAGYKRLFNIVLDLAYRSFILSNGITTDIPGVVVIDEIDLHLHPELEKVALTQLTSAFPSFQFIVTTHSSLILTSISTVDKKNRIYKMEACQTEPYPMYDIYGLDINTGMQLVMGVNPNDDELNRLISRVAYMRSKGLDQQADNLKRHILNKDYLTEEEVENRINQKLGR